jgi:hypothetical protein
MRKTITLLTLVVLVSAVPAFGEIYFWPAGTDEPCSPSPSSDKSGVASDYCTNPGSGFVGKGDVQNAFGWNNNQLQDRAGDVTFTYEGTQRYTQTCWKLVGNERNQAVITNTFRRPVVSSADFDQKTRGNKVESVTGFFLLGYGDGGGASGAPDDLCPAHGNANGVDPEDGPWLSYNPDDPSETSTPELDGESSGTDLCVHFAGSTFCWSLD